MLLVVFLFANHDIAVDENVVEQKELSGLWPFAAHLGEDTFADEDTAGNRQRLRKKDHSLFIDGYFQKGWEIIINYQTGAAEAVLHHHNAPGIRLTVNYRLLRQIIEVYY